MNTQVHSCNCIGPQGGQPLCPCMMRGVQVVDGRYIKTQDLGPVTPSLPERQRCPGCSAETYKHWKNCALCGHKIEI